MTIKGLLGLTLDKRIFKMYDWQLNSKNVQKFSSGQTVKLNEDWSGYAYLKREYDSFFPRRIASISGDIVRFHVGKMEVPFASQCLSAG